jgi:hypothetical protein
MIIAGAVLGALLLVLCIGGGVFLVNQLSKDKDDPKDPVAQNSTAPTTGGSPKAIDCNGMKGKTSWTVKEALEKDGFTVKIVVTQSAGERDSVLNVTPCQATSGSEISVEVPRGSDPSATNPTRGPSGRPSGRPGNSGVPCVPIPGIQTCPPSPRG